MLKFWVKFERRNVPIESVDQKKNFNSVGVRVVD